MLCNQVIMLTQSEKGLNTSSESSAVVSTENQVQVKESSYTENDVQNLRKCVFNRDGIILDRLMKDLQLKDHQTLQVVNKEFSQVVTEHGPSWSKRKIVITKDNVNELSSRPPNLPWTAAKVDLLLVRHFKAVQFVWKGLEEFCLVNSTCSSQTKRISAYVIQNVLGQMSNLTRLTISANLLCSGWILLRDLKNLEDVLFSKLTHFEIVLARQRPTKGTNYNSFVFKNPVMSKYYFWILSTFQWRMLDTFKLHRAELATQSILTNNFLQNVRTLELNVNNGDATIEHRLWRVMKNIEMPNLTNLNTKLYTTAVHRDFCSFFYSQPQITSLNLKVNSFTDALFMDEEDRADQILLKHLSIYFKSTLWYIEDVSLSFLKKLKHLESIMVEASKENHSMWPPALPAGKVIEHLPSSVSHLNLNLCVVYWFIGGQVRTREFMENALEELAYMNLPNLIQCNIKLQDCSVCDHVVEIGSRDFV